MESCYDVIVVGAGNAGLSAAATTAQNGLKTLVIERNQAPGGCATSFRRGRFEFEASLHELANIGTAENPGSIRKLLDSYGVQVDWRLEKNLFRTITGGEKGYDLRMPSGIGAFIDELERLVPGSRESATAVFELVKKVGKAIAYLSSGKPDPAVLMAEHADFLRIASHSVDQVLAALQMPEKAACILKTYWPYLGAPTDQMDFALYAVMVERYVAGTPAMPAKTSHELSMAMETALRAMGVEFWYHTQVTEVLFEGSRAVGVRAGDRCVYAKHIVLNCSPSTALGRLIPAPLVPERAAKLANARKSGVLFFTVYLGLDRSCAELGIEDYSLFLCREPDSVSQFEDCRRDEGGPVIVNCLNQVIPDATPEGTCSLFLTTILTEEAWGDVSPRQYRRVKNRIADRLIACYEQATGIQVREHIEEIVIAAPPTFARYLNTPNGTPYGYMIQPWDSMIQRVMNRKQEQFFGGLTFVGAHGENTDGYSSTLSNGHSAGKRIVKELSEHG